MLMQASTHQVRARAIRDTRGFHRGAVAGRARHQFVHAKREHGRAIEYTRSEHLLMSSSRA